MKKRAFAIFAFSALGVASASAADLPTAKPAPMMAAPPQYNWTGFYLGGHIDWVWANDPFNAYNATTGAFLVHGEDNDTTFHGGLQGGYRYEFPNNFVLGAGASVSWGTSATNTHSNAAGTNIYRTETSGDMNGTVDVSAGYSFGDLLPYVIGGWSWDTADVTRTQLVGRLFGATPGTSESTSFSRNGWNIGAGLEYRVWQNLSVFAQYSYTQYGSVNLTFPVANVRSNSTLNANAIVLGANYKFW